MEKPKNILLITIDSLRYDHLSAYGYDKETTPNLDMLAADGTLFENVIAPANWTGAAIASILTGLYPTSHGYTNLRYFLDNEIKTLPGILQENNYKTVCFSNNMYISSRTGLAQGFDQFFYQGGLDADRKSNPKKSYHSLTAQVKKMLPHRLKSHLRDVIDSTNIQKSLKRDDGACKTEKAFKKWHTAQNNDNTPFFAYIHYQEPHSIYFPPRPYRKRFFSGSWLKESSYLKFDHIGYYAGQVDFSEQDIQHYQELYDGEIAYLDWRIGRLFDYLKEQNIFDNTLIIVTADHGELFGENGYLWHAFCLHDSLIKVPMIIHFPEWFARGTNTNLVQTNDIVPTICDGLGINWEYESEKQAFSFLSSKSRNAALTETYSPEKMIDRWLKRRTDLDKEEFTQYIRDIKSYRTLSEKYIWGSDGWNELYDLAADPLEKENLIDRRSEQAQFLSQKLSEWNETLRPHVADPTHPGFDKDTWEKLKALGYA